MRQYNLSILKKSGGIILIFCSFLSIYYMLGIGVIDGEKSSFVYWLMGFALLIAIAGTVMIFMEIRYFEESYILLDNSNESPDFKHAIKQLSRNYDVLRRQTTQGFTLACVLMLLGVCVILIGSIAEIFGLTKEVGRLTTVSGVVIETVSGIGLLLFRQTFQRLNDTSDRLYGIWIILVAFNKAEGLPEEKRIEVIASLITKLVDGRFEQSEN
jgi:hypothetical protein